MPLRYRTLGVHTHTHYPDFQPCGMNIAPTMPYNWEFKQIFLNEKFYVKTTYNKCLFIGSLCLSKRFSFQCYLYISYLEHNNQLKVEWLSKCSVRELVVAGLYFSVCMISLERKLSDCWGLRYSSLISFPNFIQRVHLSCQKKRPRRLTCLWEWNPGSYQG